MTAIRAYRREMMKFYIVISIVFAVIISVGVLVFRSNMADATGGLLAGSRGRLCLLRRFHRSLRDAACVSGRPDPGDADRPGHDCRGRQPGCLWLGDSETAQKK